MLHKLKACQLNSTRIAVNGLENNYMQCNGKADTIKISLPHILTILRNEKKKFKIALENKIQIPFTM